MKILAVIMCRINNLDDHLMNALFPEYDNPFRWVAEMNAKEESNPDKNLVKRQYVLVNYWKVSDYEVRGITEDGTGYLKTDQFPSINTKNNAVNSA